MNSYVFAVDATRLWWHLCDAPPPYALSAASQSYLIHCFLVDACDVILFSVRRYVFVLEKYCRWTQHTHTYVGFVLVAIGIGVTLGVSAGTDDTFGPVEVLGAVPIVLGAIFLLIALVMFSRKKSEAIPEA